MHIVFIAGSFARRYVSAKQITAARFLQMTINDANDEKVATLSISRVYRLMELERVEMEKRALEYRTLHGRLKTAA